jgi:hypothetical protein
MAAINTPIIVATSPDRSTALLEFSSLRWSDAGWDGLLRHVQAQSVARLELQTPIGS